MTESEVDEDTIEVPLFEDEEKPWLELLCDDAPSLWAARFAIEPTEVIPVALSKEHFKSRFREALVRIDKKLKVPSVHLLDFLYDRAVFDMKLVSAWNTTTKRIKSPEFKQSFDFLKQELTRYKKIQSLARQERAIKTPAWMSDWQKYWDSSIRDHLSEIEDCLNGCQSQMESYALLGRMGRVKINSHLLLLSQSSICQKLEGTPDARHSTAIFLAYGLASELIEHDDSANGDSFSALQMRLYRSRKFKRHMKNDFGLILSTFIALHGATKPSERD